MRLFTDIFEAGREIERDLSKSPEAVSHSVQNIQTEVHLREALGYMYSVTDPRLPTISEILDYAVEMRFIEDYERDEYANWLVQEMINRSAWRPKTITEEINPHLRGVIEGSEPSYTYTDMLRGSQQLILETLLGDPGTRRAYFPIFHPEDSIRAPRATRIPCSLGYWFAIREVDGKKYLHMTYLERSCDFRRFWLFDIYMAKVYQTQILQELKRSDMDIQLGALTHTLLSFHLILDSDEEIY